MGGGGARAGEARGVGGGGGARTGDALDDRQREAAGLLAGERVKTDDLALALGLGLAAEHRTLGHVTPKPHAPAVELVGARSVQDNALCETVVVLKEEHNRLVEVLLPQSEAKLLLRSAQDDAALLDQGGFVHEPAGLARCTRTPRLLLDKLGPHLSPVHVRRAGLIVVGGAEAEMLCAEAAARPQPRRERVQAKSRRQDRQQRGPHHGKCRPPPDAIYLAGASFRLWTAPTGMLERMMTGLWLVASAAASSLPCSAPLRPLGTAGTLVRYCYEGATLKRNGRLLPLSTRPTGESVLAALEADGADLQHFAPRVYDSEMEGWAPLLSDTNFAHDELEDQSLRPQIHVTLFRKRPPAVPPLEEAATSGFFTCGVVGAKNSHNLGSLWRSAFQLGAAGIFIVNDRGATAPLRESSDTMKAWRHVPLVRYDDWNAFSAAQPFGAQWVAVEMGGEPLEDFVHPERAVYILGSEDSGLPESVLRSCHRHVTLPCERAESFNGAHPPVPHPSRARPSLTPRVSSRHLASRAQQSPWQALSSCTTDSPSSERPVQI